MKQILLSCRKMRATQNAIMETYAYRLIINFGPKSLAEKTFSLYFPALSHANTFAFTNLIYSIASQQIELFHSPYAYFRFFCFQDFPITFKDGMIGVNFGGYHAEAGLGGLLTGNAAHGGLIASAGTPSGQSAVAGLGGNSGRK